MCMLILREYYTVAWRYNYYFQVVKITFCKREQGVKYCFSPQENKTHIEFFAHTHKKNFKGKKLMISSLPWRIHQLCSKCVFPEIFHTPTTEDHWKFQGGGGVLKAKIFEGKYEPEPEFSEGWGVQTKKPSIGGVWIFLEQHNVVSNEFQEWSFFH